MKNNKLGLMTLAFAATEGLLGCMTMNDEMGGARAQENVTVGGAPMYAIRNILQKRGQFAGSYHLDRSRSGGRTCRYIVGPRTVHGLCSHQCWQLYT